MTDTDQKLEDETLRRMLKTPPMPHKGNGDGSANRAGNVTAKPKAGPSKS